MKKVITILNGESGIGKTTETLQYIFEQSKKCDNVKVMHYDLEDNTDRERVLDITDNDESFINDVYTHEKLGETTHYEMLKTIMTFLESLNKTVTQYILVDAINYLQFKGIGTIGDLRWVFNKIKDTIYDNDLNVHIVFIEHKSKSPRHSSKSHTIYKKTEMNACIYWFASYAFYYQDNWLCRKNRYGDLENYEKIFDCLKVADTAKLEKNIVYDRFGLEDIDNAEENTIVAEIVTDEELDEMFNVESTTAYFKNDTMYTKCCDKIAKPNKTTGVYECTKCGKTCIYE